VEMYYILQKYVHAHVCAEKIDAKHLFRLWKEHSN
jgi:hypothetical protein